MVALFVVMAAGLIGGAFTDFCEMNGWFPFIPTLHDTIE
jgi:hypothetical protein